MHGVIALNVSRNRKGRKRKSGRRTLSGQLARPPVDYRAIIAAQPHRRDLPESTRTHERAESLLGRLNLLKRISEQQFEAGRRYAVLVGAYHSIIGVPHGVVGGARNAIGCIPEQCASSSACYCLRAKERYQAATRVLLIEGQAAYNAVYAVAISDRAANEITLNLGLSALADHFGLTTGGKSRL